MEEVRSDPHDHERATIWFLITGEWTDSTGVVSHVLRAGDLLFHLGPVRHTMSGSSVVELLSIEIPSEFLEPYQPLYRERARSFVVRRGRLGELPNRLVRELGRCDDAVRLGVEALVAQLLVEGSRRRRRAAGRPLWVVEALRYIETATDHLVRAGEIARVIGLNERQVRDGFRRHVGKRVSEVSLEARVRAAYERLGGNLSMSAIAQELGFYDQSHLTKAFRRALSATPSQLRPVDRSRR